MALVSAVPARVCHMALRRRRLYLRRVRQIRNKLKWLALLRGGMSGIALCVALLVLMACGDPRVDIEASGPAADTDRVFEMAAEGDPTAQTSLGLIYERGLGVDKDPTEAMRWYRRAASEGDALAAFHLGSLFERGVGTEQNYDEAAQWYARAADGGIEAALTALAYLYERGLGVERDFQEAEALYGAAARSDDSDSESAGAAPAFSPDRDGQHGALPITTMRDLALDGPAEFAVGEEEQATIEVDLGALDEAQGQDTPMVEFDGPVPVAGRGVNFPLKTSGPLLSPEDTPVDSSLPQATPLPERVLTQPTPPRPVALSDEATDAVGLTLYPPKTPLPPLDRPLSAGN